MQLSTALIIFVIVALIVFFAARAYRVRFFSSLVLALLIGSLVLAALVNPMDIINAGQDSASLYGLVMAIVTIILLIYILVKASQDIDYDSPSWWSRKTEVVERM